MKFVSDMWDTEGEMISGRDEEDLGGIYKFGGIEINKWSCVKIIEDLVYLRYCLEC